MGVDTVSRAEFFTLDPPGAPPSEKGPVGRDVPGRGCFWGLSGVRFTGQSLPGPVSHLHKLAPDYPDIFFREQNHGKIEWIIMSIILK